MTSWRTYTSDGADASFDALLSVVADIRARGGVIVTTNGCFDLLHSGHVRFLEEARACGDLLVVAINSDVGVRALKGPGRPVIAEADRASVLLALAAVDHVVAFDERTPSNLLSALKPTIHCKGGDYAGASLPESDAVMLTGGEIRILGLHGDHSTSGLVRRVAQTTAPLEREPRHDDPRVAAAASGLAGVARTIEMTALEATDTLVAAALRIAAVIEADGTVFLCGNGGSATQAQHVAAELVGRFRRDGFAAPAIALSADPAVITALANDFGFHEVFARQLEALGRPGDALVVITTSGRSSNVIRASEAARERGMLVIGMTGASPGGLADSCDYLVSVPSHDTSSIQVAHLAALHELCELVEDVAPASLRATEDQSN
jgi:D-sedoheptulose 7-phosphate isomerase